MTEAFTFYGRNSPNGSFPLSFLVDKVRLATDLILKEELIRARLSELGFALEREPVMLVW